MRWDGIVSVCLSKFSYHHYQFKRIKKCWKHKHSVLHTNHKHIIRSGHGFLEPCLESYRDALYMCFSILLHLNIAVSHLPWLFYESFILLRAVLKIHGSSEEETDKQAPCARARQFTMLYQFCCAWQICKMIVFMLITIIYYWLLHLSFECCGRSQATVLSANPARTYQIGLLDILYLA